jgi:hypothetical protein
MRGDSNNEESAMGALVELVSVFNLNASLNIRFSAGDPIEEMAALHREFKIFTSTHDLRSAAALLGLVPDTAREREDWLGYLDHLKTLDSDDEGQNGHDRIRSALADNLGSRTPLPVYFRYHDGKRDARVVVATGTPLIFLEVMHLIVSVPTLIAREAMRTTVKRAGPWSSRKSAQAPAPAAAKKAAAKSAKKSAKK